MTAMGRKILFVLGAGLFGLFGNLQDGVAAVVVTENFDTPGAITANVTVGTSPNAATLIGGTKNEVIGFGNLYDTGVRSWMFRPGETGDIVLENPITAIDVFFAHVNGLTATLSFFDVNSNLVTSIASLNAADSMPDKFELDFATQVTDIQLVVNGVAGFVAIDSLSLEFADPAVVPLPAALPLFASALIGLGLAVRRNKQAP